MTPEQFIDRNIDNFLARADKTKEFSVSDIQRICHIGYNQACYTRDALVCKKVIEKASSEWRFKFVGI